MKHIVTRFVPFAVTLTLLTGMLYVALQQDMRARANYPQIQMAEDAARALTSGAKPQQVIPQNIPFDIAQSLAAYTVVYDDAGKPIGASAHLNGQPPTPPAGVFGYVRAHGEDRISWQPEPGVRSAIVVTRYEGTSSGFVLAGRSLREVEEQVDRLGQRLLIGWVFSCIVLFVTLIMVKRVFRKAPVAPDAQAHLL